MVGDTVLRFRSEAGVKEKEAVMKVILYKGKHATGVFRDRYGMAIAFLFGTRKK